MFKYIKLYNLYKLVEVELKKEEWYVSRDFYSSLVVFLAKCCSAFFEVEISQDIQQVVINNLHTMSICILETTKIVLETIQQIKQKKQ